MYFPYFQIFSTKVPLKFEKYMKLLDIFGDTISKCPDIIRKNTPLLAHSLDSSPSIELKLLVNLYESPCRMSNLMQLHVGWTSIEQRGIYTKTINIENKRIAENKLRSNF